jgi:hypothetical protein
MAKAKNSCRIFMVNPLENDCLEDREGDGRVTLKYILGNKVKRIEGEGNWLRIVSSG